jgi:hypothetical protein
VGFFDLYRSRMPQGSEPEVDGAEQENELEPLSKLTLSEFWPPSPRVKPLLIGMGFFMLNFLLLCIWAWALYVNR